MKKLLACLSIPWILLAINVSNAQQLWITAYYETFAYCDLQPQEIDYKAITHLIVFTSEPSTTYPYMREMTNPNDSAILETGRGLNGSGGWCYNIASNNNTNGITHQSIMRDSCRKYGVKLILCLGGEVGDNATNFNWVIADTNRQNAYIAAVIGYITRHGFQGVDIDLEYANNRVMFDRFITRFRRELNKMNPRGILTMAVDKDGGNPNRMTPSVANAAFDQMNIMGYGLGNSQYSGYNSGMARPNLPNYTAWTLADHGIQLLKSQGYDPAKIGLLIPFEVMFWTGVSGAGQLSQGNPQFSSYSNVVGAINTSTVWSPTWDNIAKVPGFGYTSGVTKYWYSYEDSNSIPIKVQYARDQHIGGVGAWGLYRGWLKNNPIGKHDPLLQALKKAVNNIVPPVVNPCDSAYQRGYLAGKASVVCPPSVPCDTLKYFNNGKNYYKSLIPSTVSKQDTTIKLITIPVIKP